MTMGNANHSGAIGAGPTWLAGAAAHALLWGLLPLGAVGTIAGVGIMMGGVGSTAVMAAVADPMSVLAARSPGARPAGALTQTKAAKADAPGERVLASVLTRPLDRFASPAGGDTPGVASTVPGDTIADAVTNATAPTTTGDLPVSGSDVGGFIGTPGGLVVTPGAGGTSGGGGGGSGGGGGTVVTPTNPTTPVASVPEPATWFSLILGFAAMGITLRRRDRQAQPVAVPLRRRRG